MRWSAVLVTIFIAAFALTGCSSAPEEQAPQVTTVAKTTPASQGKYFCKVCKRGFPKGGNCPNCGMPLAGTTAQTADAPVVLAGKKSGKYFCKVCKITHPKDGNCPRCGMPLIEVKRR